MKLGLVAAITGLDLMLGLSSMPVAQERPSFRSETTTVSVNVSVRDGNRPVAGLTAADFQLADSGVVQHIDDVAVESVPIDVTLIVDTSNSARAEFDRFRSDTRQIAGFLGDQDRLRLLTIDTYVHELTPMQPAREVAIPERPATGGMTSAYDALVAAMIARPSLARRQLIVAMTDAWDTISVLDAEAVRDVAARSDAVLHIALTSESASYYNSFPARSLYHDRDLAALTDAAVRTGGALHTAGLSQTANIVEMFKKVFDDFRVSYVLHYNPAGVAREGWHPLNVSTPRFPAYQLTSRQGYFGG